MMTTAVLQPNSPVSCPTASPNASVGQSNLEERVNNTFLKYLGIALIVFGAIGWMTCQVLAVIVNPLYMIGVGIGVVAMLIGIFMLAANSSSSSSMVLHPPESNLDSMAIELGRNYTINERRKRDAPDRIDWNTVFSERDVRHVRIEELLGCFDEVLGRSATSTNFDDVTILERRGLRRGIERFVQFIIERDLDHDTNTSPYYYDQLNLIMKNIILELKKPEIDAGKKYDVLKELSIAAGHCTPRKLEEALRQFRYITNRPDTLDNRFREWLQTYKEDVILRYFQSGQFHVLNDARVKVQDWGLDQPSAFGSRDQYRGVGGDFSASEYREKLMQNYTSAHLISVIQTKASFHEAIPLITLYLQEAYASGDLDDDTLERILQTFGDRTELTFFGAAWLLARMHFIDPVQ